MPRYRDQSQWSAVRDRVLKYGASRRQVSRETGISTTMINKMLSHPHPPTPVKAVPKRPKLGPYITTVEKMLGRHASETCATHSDVVAIFEYIRSDGYSGSLKSVKEFARQISRRKFQKWGYVYDAITSLDRQRAIKFLYFLGEADPKIVSSSNADALRRACKLVTEVQWKVNRRDANRLVAREWMHNLVQGSYSQKDLRTDVGEINDLRTLYDQMRRGTPINRKKAAAIISHAKGIVDTTAYEFLNLSKAAFKKTITDYLKNDIDVIFKKRQSRFRKSENESIKQEVFRVLHQPPSEYGFNRTTWKMADFREALKRNGHVISGEVIRKIAKSAGFRWRKAKVVLTSSDPDYSEKLARITNILESLGDDEAFFSIDEFGPLAVKIIGGKVLSAPGKVPTVPQGQRSKGTIIITAALELSSNQITHFYSDRKNTSEMIALMKKLANEYQGKKRIYLSWDAASWHISKQLFSAISEHNAASLGKLPIVETAPLPASAQFLNVIESVFSGMARAVLHSSNYASVECAKVAIDRHFRERNDYFRQNPKRAGKKIWGQERVPSIFSEGANCKAAEYCWGAS